MLTGVRVVFDSFFFWDDRFLQDGHQVQLRLYDVEDLEKIENLAKLYSLNMERDNECTILTKTR